MPFDPPLTQDEVAAAFDGRFEILDPVASGGQGSVYRARAHPTLSGGAPVVALKIYFEDQVEERTAREIAAMRTIQGETLVSLVDEGRCEVRSTPCIYIATSFIAGETLADAIGRGPLDPALVAQIGHDVAIAIEALWTHRIVHRDIKPNNIMITEAGRAVLIDLGLARHLTLSPLTSAGKTWGTEGYFSPEHAQGGSLTCKSDVFALGIVLQEALLGRHPTGRRQGPLLSGGPPTGALRAGLPAPLVTVIDAMLHRSAVHRPMPREVIGRLAPLLGH